MSQWKELLEQASTGVEQSRFPRIKTELFVGIMHQKSVGISSPQITRPSLSACLVNLLWWGMGGRRTW